MACEYTAIKRSLGDMQALISRRKAHLARLSFCFNSNSSSSILVFWNENKIVDGTANICADYGGAYWCDRGNTSGVSAPRHKGMVGSVGPVRAPDPEICGLQACHSYCGYTGCESG